MKDEDESKVEQLERKLNNCEALLRMRKAKRCDEGHRIDFLNSELQQRDRRISEAVDEINRVWNDRVGENPLSTLESDVLAILKGEPVPERLFEDSIECGGDKRIDDMMEAKQRLDENAEKTLKKVYADQLAREAEQQEDRPRFKPGDKVWILHKGKAKEVTVDGMDYWLNHDGPGYGSVCSSEVFATRQELIESL